MKHLTLHRFIASSLLLPSFDPHTPPPPDILCWYTEPWQKSGAVLAFTQRFGHEDFILQKSLLKVLKRAWTRLFYIFLNFKLSTLITKLQLSQNQ
jgi:hypothetical protein